MLHNIVLRGFGKNTMEVKIPLFKEVRKPWGTSQGGQVEAGVMEVLEEDGKIIAVNFMCPCGCGDNCFLYIDQNRDNPSRPRPTWGYTTGPTLTPSIFSKKELNGCGAHFYIEKGLVRWV